MLDPVPGEAAADFASNVMSRFQYLNPLINYLLEKENHGFEQGDAICIEDEQYVLSDSDNVGKFIGTVVHAGPGPHQFILRPANGIIDFVPSLPGIVGDYVYPSIDGSGDLTIDDASRRPIYMKIAESIPSSTTGTGADPAGVNGDIIEFNRMQMTLESASGEYNLDDAVSIINSFTAYHKITASKVGGSTSVVSDTVTLGTAYGIVAGYAPFSASINGVLVNFITTVSGAAAYGDPSVADVNDMVLDINNANVPDIVASVVDGVNLKLTNTAGGEITVANVNRDTNDKDFAGSGSVSALALYTPANTTSYSLRLTRLDGGPITIRDVQGEFLDRCGVMSGQTGRYALGLNIEQGLRSSKTSVVADMSARDALNALVGDQCYVIADSNGEWAMFLYDGTQWNRVGNKRSDNTDARTLFAEIDIAGLADGVNVIPLGSVSSGRKITNISIAVTERSLSSTVQVRTATGTNLLMQTQDNNLTAQGEYIASTNYITTNLTSVVIDVTKSVGDTGEFSVTLTYV